MNTHAPAGHPARFLPPLLIVLLLACAPDASAQGTAFKYEGQIPADRGAPASYDLEFKLFDAAAGGTQQGPTLSFADIALAGNVYAVVLDFGGAAFAAGEPRFLEIGYRAAGSADPYQLVPQRDTVLSVPYAVRAASAASADGASNLGGVPAGQYVLTDDPRLADARPPAPGGGDYVQNRTTPQAGASFNVEGGGTVGGLLSGGEVNSAGKYHVGGAPALSTNGSSTAVGLEARHAGAGGYNTYLGFAAGKSSGGFSLANTFVGSETGQLNTTGSFNTFVGREAGFFNTTGHNNTYVGVGAGKGNKTGSENSFFGYNAGYANSGPRNSFFGFNAGKLNTWGADNSFFGYLAGQVNVGGDNSFFGSKAGAGNTDGVGNSFFGSKAGSGVTKGSINSAFGQAAGGCVAQSAEGNSFFGAQTGGCGGISNNTAVGVHAGEKSKGDFNTFLGAYADLPHGAPAVTHSTAIGAGATVKESHTIALGTKDEKVLVPGNAVIEGRLSVGGKVSFNHIAQSGSNPIPICFDMASRQLTQCASSLRYKHNVAAYRAGLAVVTRLRPITFDWNEGGRPDLGFGAEEVAGVEPLLVTRDEQGRTQGVRYDLISVALVNAVKEQQSQIERQQREIDELRRLLTARPRARGRRTRTARAR